MIFLMILLHTCWDFLLQSSSLQSCIAYKFGREFREVFHILKLWIIKLNMYTRFEYSSTGSSMHVIYILVKNTLN